MGKGFTAMRRSALHRPPADVSSTTAEALDLQAVGTWSPPSSARSSGHSGRAGGREVAPWDVKEGLLPAHATYHLQAALPWVAPTEAWRPTKAAQGRAGRTPQRSRRQSVSTAGLQPEDGGGGPARRGHAWVVTFQSSSDS